VTNKMPHCRQGVQSISDVPNVIGKLVLLQSIDAFAVAVTPKVDCCATDADVLKFIESRAPTGFGCVCAVHQ
jgi:hypothetical protein